MILPDPPDHRPPDEQPPQRSRIECRDCAVICERVVYPSYCLRAACRYVYAFVQDGSTFFGCLQKVFVAELDVAPFVNSPGADHYGALRTRREPLPECRAQIEQAYKSSYVRRDCCNPTFRHHIREFSPEAVRVLVEGPRRARGPDPSPAR
jgi:hypothetical protein